MPPSDHPGLPDVFWIGERSEYTTTDFDGQVRRGVVLGTLALAASKTPSSPTYVWLRLEPPLRLLADEHDEVVITERHVGTSLRSLGQTSISVYMFEVGSRKDAENGVFEPTQAGLLAWADVALDPVFLPETQEAGFDRVFRLVERFVGREGHAAVPYGQEEDGLTIGVWVQNMKHTQFDGRLRPDWEARLAALPGWQWYQVDEFTVLESFARREGHTDVPFDHLEGERTLGMWLSIIRSSRPYLPIDWIDRLEAIPNWHW